MGQLTIKFAGIMTHFYNCVPFDSIEAKIPMRSVLPDALGIYMGVLQRKQNITESNLPLQFGYYLMPHVALISDVETVVPGTSNWIPLVGARMQVANPASDVFTPPPVEAGYHLDTYVENLKISKDVVQNGNAAGYFDTFFGTVSVQGDKNDPKKPLWTQVVIDTVDDTPLLDIIPFPGSPMNLAKYPFLNAKGQWPLPGGELYVSNYDFDSGTEDIPIEFLLNYLVAEGGLPRVLKENLPGMPPSLDELTLQLLGQRLVSLGLKIENYPQSPAALTREALARAGIQGPVPLDQSCSDSRFP
jgi:hypothetical protein